METTKAAMIAAVSAALKFKRENPNATEEDVISYIVGQCNEILGEMDAFEE